MPIQIDDLHTKTVALLGRLMTDKQIDVEMRDSIAELLSELDRTIIRQGERVCDPASAESPSALLTERFVDAGRRFEAAHPLLSRALEDFADALSQMGI
jgi:hypothetical protein